MSATMSLTLVGQIMSELTRLPEVDRFHELTEEIRQEAITKGTAIEGDWRGD